MRNLLFLISLIFITTTAYPQWFYGTGKAVNLENDIGYNKNTQLIKSGVTVDPKTSSLSAGAGSLAMKTDGSLYIKMDAGNTTNWRKFLDDTFSVVASLGYTPVPNTTTVNGHALNANVTVTKTDVGLGNVPDVDATNPVNTATDATHRYVTDAEKITWNAKESALTFSGPLSRAVNTISIPVATTATSGYISSTDWTTFNNKQAALGFTPEDVANKSTTTTLGTSNTLYPSQNAVKTYVDTISASKADDISAITKDVSGFYDPSSVAVSYDTATDKITITGDTTVYWRGKVVTTLPSGWTSPAHPVGSGTWFLYYDGATATTTWSSTPWSFDKVQIALAFDQTYAHFGLREPHGTMPQLVHKELHETVGTYMSSGGDFSSYTPASFTPANRRPDISAAIINDEDVPSTNAALTSKLYTTFSLSGVAATASLTTDYAEIVPVSGSRPYYNQFTGGAWQQTPMSNNAYQAIFVLAVPVTSDAVSQKYRFMFVQGQSESTTLATIQALTSSSVNLNGFVSSAPEFTFIGKIIIQYVSGSTDWRITSVEKLTGNKILQGTSTGNWLSSVSSSTDFTGDGTALNPLSLSASITDALWTASSTDIYRASGKVGIGTNSPSSKLTVLDNSTTVGNTTKLLRTGFDGNWGMYVKQNYVGAADINYIIGTNYNSTSDVDTIGIKNGKVGIGTMAPASLFHVSTLAGVSGAVANIQNVQTTVNTADTADGSLNVTNSISASSASNELVNRTMNLTATNNLTGGGAITNQWLLNIISNSNAGTSTTLVDHITLTDGTKSGTVTTSRGINVGAMYGTSAAGVVVANQTLGTNNSNMILGTTTVPAANYSLYSPSTYQSYFAGNVGIQMNTASTTTAFQVGGTVSAGRNAKIDNTGRLTLEYGDNATPTAINFLNSSTAATTDNGTQMLWQFSDTVGTITNAATLAVKKEQQWTATASTRDSYMQFSTNLDGAVSEKMRLSSDGNLGIATVAPATKLHVTGDSTVTGYTYIGGLPSADGTFRMYVSGGALITEKRISGVWTEVSRVDEN